MTEEIGGYFIWWKTQKGPPEPRKIDKSMYDGRQPDSRALDAIRELKVVPLTITQFKILNLTDLARKYPYDEDRYKRDTPERLGVLPAGDTPDGQPGVPKKEGNPG